MTASPLRSHTTAAKVRSKKRQGRREDSEYGEESSYDDGMEPSVGPGIEHSGRLSPVPQDNGMTDLMTTTTSAPSPRRTRRARVPAKLEDDGTFDEEVSGRQPIKQTSWSIPPVQHDMPQLQPYKSDLLTKTFVQCENMECGKWRKGAAQPGGPPGQMGLRHEPRSQVAFLPLQAPPWQDQSRESLE